MAASSNSKTHLHNWMWAGGGWRSQPVLRHGCCTNGSVSVTTSGRAVGLCSWTWSWSTQLSVAADFCKTWSGTRWTWAPTLPFFTDTSKKMWYLYLPWYCVGSSARPQSQKAIGVSLTPSCQLPPSLVTFFSVKRMNEPSEKADFQPLTFFLSSCRQTWADPFTKCCLCSMCMPGRIFWCNC